METFVHAGIHEGTLARRNAHSHRHPGMPEGPIAALACRHPFRAGA